MEDETTYIAPISAIRIDRNARQFVQLQSGRDRDAGEYLVELIKSAVDASNDMSWPASRALAFHLRDVGRVELPNGWVAEPVAMESPWNIAFKIGTKQPEAGYFFNCAVHPVMTPQAVEVARKIHKRKQEAFAALKETLDPSEVEKAKFKHFYVDKDPEEVSLKSDLASYLDPRDCPAIDALECRAFGRAARPQGWEDGTPAPLPKVLKTPIGEWCSEMVFDFSYPWDFGHPYKASPRMESLGRYGDMNANIVAIRMLGEAITAAGLSKLVSDRRELFRDIAYEFATLGGKYELSDKLSKLVIEIAVGSVFEDGGCIADLTTQVVGDFWGMTAATDFDGGQRDFTVMKHLLREHGHISADTGMECGDMDDFAWLVEKSETEGTIWLTNQHGQYRVDYLDDGNSVLTTIARTGKDAFVHNPRPIAPGQQGFLIAFRTDRLGEPSEVEAAAEFSTRSMKDLNNVLFSMRSVCCCLEEEYGRVVEGDLPASFQR